jgi:hypothetical protein
MGCDATITLTSDGDTQGDQFFLYGREHAWCMRGFGEIGECLIDVRDQLSERSPLGRELIEYISTVGMYAFFGHLSLLR